MGKLVKAARESGIIRGLGRDGIKHHCSIYADDVILFAHPDFNEVGAIKEILDIFAGAPGLRTNLSKCSVTNIFRAEEELPRIQQKLGCQIATFPIKYLGLPLSVHKIPKEKIRETVQRRLPACHGPLMTKSGRLIG